MATSHLNRRVQSKQIICTLLILICPTLFSLSAFTQDAAPAPTPAPAPAPAPTTFLTQKYLLGDWGGERTKLAEEKGISFDFFYVTDMLAATSAAVHTGSGAWNRVRGTMDIDFNKLAGWKGFSFHVTGLWQGGVNVGAQYLGSISNPSGLVSQRTEILDSYWLAWAMPGNKATLRFGQFASMDYYGLQSYGGNYLMEPLDYGFNNRFNDYASFDPASGPGVQLIVTPYPFVNVSMAYTSGNRNPYFQDPNGFHYVKHNSGVLSDSITINVDQTTPGKPVKEKYYPGQYEVGSTYNNGKFTDPFFPVPLYQSTDTGNYVFYMSANQAVYRPKPHNSSGLDLLFGLAFSPNAPYNFVNRNMLAGLRYNGPFPSRPQDSIGFGVSYSHVSDQYNSSYLLANPGAHPYGSETAYEVNYLFQPTPYWIIQPVLQWYTSVGGISSNGTGVVIGFRTKVNF